ncbi:MAG: ribosome assembly RNA-binding protein YhbY [Deltaproteobacteria bacterium]|nr:ribosome assembly RNA-binding protein YhbY [Deltaproteobacteria bacterium]
MTETTNEAGIEKRPKSPLTSKQKKFLRGEAHHLDPLVRVGNSGLTPQLAEAVLDALDTHELVKVKVLEGAPVDKNEAGEYLATHCGAYVVGAIGRIVILYRRHPKRPMVPLPSR